MVTKYWYETRFHVIYVIEVINNSWYNHVVESVADATSLYLRGILPADGYKRYCELHA